MFWQTSDGASFQLVYRVYMDCSVDRSRARRSSHRKRQVQLPDKIREVHYSDYLFTSFLFQNRVHFSVLLNTLIYITAKHVISLPGWAISGFFKDCSQWSYIEAVTPVLNHCLIQFCSVSRIWTCMDGRHRNEKLYKFFQRFIVQTESRKITVTSSDFKFKC